LVAKGTDEPYRMFTSRAEHRILLRQDNADQRLTELGYRIGLVSDEQYRRFRAKKEALEATRAAIEAFKVEPDAINGYLETVDTSPIDEPTRLARLVVRPEVSLAGMVDHLSIRDEVIVDAPGLESSEDLVEIELKYEGYLEREKELVERMEKLESWAIPDGFDFDEVNNISIEARQKLGRIRPDNLGQASRISGVSPADVSVLMVLLKKRGSRSTTISAGDGRTKNPVADPA
jgi:tRNA uridine 5-carboxymethylaminomethyl modification enzyme